MVPAVPGFDDSFDFPGRNPRTFDIVRVEYELLGKLNKNGLLALLRF
ncbi:MAG: DUF3778 domain-containing protein [Thermoplasmata archaeon]|nr:DUF3778 domain-containing protein [Thermoplasmata archaeon]